MIKLAATGGSALAKVTFVLPAADVTDPTSVVGTFNNWTPGTHQLRRRSNGTYSVTVEVPADEPIRFRYLAAGGRWFDDTDTDVVVDETGSTYDVAARWTARKRR